MAETFLAELTCPVCRSPLRLEPLEVVGICETCGSRFSLVGHFCPQCGTYHEEEVISCRRCGLALNRRCPRCEAMNWAGAATCGYCGAPLDMLELLAQRQGLETADRLYRHMEEALVIKAREEAASAERLARMRAQDEARQAAIRRRLQEQQEQQRRLITAMLIGLALFLLVAILIMVFLESAGS